MTGWAQAGRLLTTGHYFVIYHGTLPGDLICEKCAWVIHAGDDTGDDPCPGENA